MKSGTKLMVGDYVQVVYNSQKVRAKVTAQCGDIITVQVDLDNDECVTDYNILDVSGFDLTEEFLYKNSYRVYNTPYFVQYCINYIFTIKKIDDKFLFDGIKLKYIHEFQHWFDLCHIDKEIEL